jgi:hypothetical protein
MAEDQITGGPKWIDDLRYDILAKADHPAGEPGVGADDPAVSQLSALLGQPVVDMTAEKHFFDFHLRWTPDTPTGADSAPSDRPSLFTALQEQLGMKLESGKVPVDVLVVDHAELPSDN